MTQERYSQYTTPLGTLTIKQTQTTVSAVLWDADFQPTRYIGWSFADQNMADACYVTQCLRGSALQSMHRAMLNAETTV